MMKKLALFLLAAAWAVAGFAQDRLYADEFPLGDVKLLDGPLQRARDLNVRTLLQYDCDRLLAPYRIQAGLEPRKKAYPNWDGLDGHVGGHYLAAMAMNAATGNEECRRRMEYMLAELQECADANVKNHPEWGKGYVGGMPDSENIWSRFKKGDFSVYSRAWAPPGLLRLGHRPDGRPHRCPDGADDGQRARRHERGPGRWLRDLRRPQVPRRRPPVLPPDAAEPDVAAGGQPGQPARQHPGPEGRRLRADRGTRRGRDLQRRRGVLLGRRDGRALTGVRRQQPARAFPQQGSLHGLHQRHRRSRVLQHLQHAAAHGSAPPPQPGRPLRRFLRAGHLQPHPLHPASRAWRVRVLHPGPSAPLPQLLRPERGDVVLRGHRHGEPRQIRPVHLYPQGQRPVREPLRLLGAELARKRRHAAPGDRFPVRRDEPHHGRGRQGNLPRARPLPELGEARCVLRECQREAGRGRHRPRQLRRHRPQMEEGRSSPSRCTTA